MSKQDVKQVSPTDRGLAQVAIWVSPEFKEMLKDSVAFGAADSMTALLMGASLRAIGERFDIAPELLDEAIEKGWLSDAERELITEGSLDEVDHG